MVFYYQLLGMLLIPTVVSSHAIDQSDNLVVDTLIAIDTLIQAAVILYIA